MPDSSSCTRQRVTAATATWRDSLRKHSTLHGLWIVRRAWCAQLARHAALVHRWCLRHPRRRFQRRGRALMLLKCHLIRTVRRPSLWSMWTWRRSWSLWMCSCCTTAARPELKVEISWCSRLQRRFCRTGRGRSGCTRTLAKDSTAPSFESSASRCAAVLCSLQDKLHGHMGLRNERCSGSSGATAS